LRTLVKKTVNCQHSQLSKKYFCVLI